MGNRIPKKPNKNKIVLGRLEYVDFPEWGMEGIEAKIDTGAYSSSLHCHHIEKINKNDESYVRFRLLDPSHEIYDDRLFELPLFRIKSVKSSNGVTEDRFFIKAKINIAGCTLSIELSLTDRSEMKYPVLIGRKLLKGKFMVDPSKSFLTNPN